MFVGSGHDGSSKPLLNLGPHQPRRTSFLTFVHPPKLSTEKILFLLNRRESETYSPQYSPSHTILILSLNLIHVSLTYSLPIGIKGD